MRYCALLLLLAGCQPEPKAGDVVQPEPDRARPELPNVRSVTIKYTAAEFRPSGQQITISDPKEVRALIEALRVKSVWRVFVLLAFQGRVEFHLADGSTATFCFIGPQQVEWGGHGRVDLSDRAFYDLVNKLLSKKEGRPIDVLKNNEPARVGRPLG
jgi:hypothetical protein